MDEDLIKEVEEHPCPYDTKIEAYRNRTLKERSWYKISVDLMVEGLL